MDKWAKMRQLGYWLAIAGLIVALVSIVPGVFGKDQFPWTLLVGSFIYLHGSFLVLFGSRGVDPKKTMGVLRFVRLGFVVIFVVLIMQVLNA
jgi:hypothetical protein